MLLYDERSTRPLTGLIRAEHAEGFDEEFTRAAVNRLFHIAVKGAPEKAVCPCLLLLSCRPSVGFGLGSLRVRLLGLSFSLGCFSLGRLGTGTCGGGLGLLARGCGFFFFFCSGDSTRWARSRRALACGPNAVSS